MPTTNRRRIRDPRVRFVRGQVGQRSGDSRGVVFKQADGGIASGAKKAAYRAGLMVMIYSQAFLYACVGLGYAKSLAYRAAAILSLKQGVVLGWLNAKSSTAMAVGGKAIVFLTIVFSPFRLPNSSARPAITLKSVLVSGVPRKLAMSFNRVASSAPFHTFWNFWTARCGAVMPAQVIKGLALYPSQALAIPGSNWRWSATSALAQAFRYFGHHAIPSLLGFPNNIKGKV